MTPPVLGADLLRAPGPVWREVGDPLVAAAAAGPLDGLTVAVKDLFSVAGHRVGAGVPSYLAEQQPATATAPALQRLLEAGAAVRGIAQTDEFAYAMTGANPHYGTPPNAAAPGRLPGGSSSGPASAVAAGLADIGLATDTAGSIRIPASYQGLWGLRATHDAVPSEGLLPLAPSFDTVGWLCRDGDTLARVVEVCLPSGQSVGAGQVRVAAGLLGLVGDATRDAFDTAVRGLGVGDRRVGPAELPPVDDALEAFRVVQAAEAWRADGAWFEAHPGTLGGAVAARLAAARDVTPAQESDARLRLAGYREQLRDLVRYGVLLWPTAPGPAPLVDLDAASVDVVRGTTLRLTCLAAIAGLPALSVPALTVDSAPVGLSLIGPAGSDLSLVRLALEWGLA